MKTLALSSVVLMAVATTIAAGESRSSGPLTVRLYNTAGISAPEILAGRRSAESLLRESGLDVVFRDCGRAVLPDGPIDHCDQSLKPTEVVVRVIDAPLFNASIDPDAYGFTYVIRDQGRSWLATVFSDRIAAASTRAGVETGTLLGRVIAHEVGHLLLGSAYHGSAGVMRAVWSDELLNRGDETWRFSRLEGARMQHALEAEWRRHDADPATTPF